MEWISLYDRSPGYEDGPDDLLLTVSLKGRLGGEYRRVYPGWYEVDNHRFCVMYGGLSVSVSKIGRVVAWMPMPDTYKGQ